jgi:hypothetical protein
MRAFRDFRILGDELAAIGLGPTVLAACCFGLVPAPDDRVILAMSFGLSFLGVVSLGTAWRRTRVLGRAFCALGFALPALNARQAAPRFMGTLSAAPAAIPGRRGRSTRQEQLTDEPRSLRAAKGAAPDHEVIDAFLRLRG